MRQAKDTQGTTPKNASKRVYASQGDTEGEGLGVVCVGVRVGVTDLEEVGLGDAVVRVKSTGVVSMLGLLASRVLVRPMAHTTSAVNGKGHG